MALSASSVLHYWSSRYGTIPIVGGNPVHSRASIAKWVDQMGVVREAPVNTPRFEWATIDGERRPVTRLEQARTNLCLRSEDLGTSPWATGGTPTRVAAARTAAGVTLDLVGDDSGAAAEEFHQTCGFTGDGTKAVSVHVAQGTAAKSLVRINEPGGDKLLGEIGWTAAGLPSVTMAVGTYVGYVALGAGVFRILFETTAVTAANANVFYFYPAETTGVTGAGTGTVYVGGVQWENASSASSYIKTTTASVSRSVDSFYWDFPHAPQAMATYCRFVHRHIQSGARLWGITSDSDAPSRVLVYMNGSGRYYFYHHEGGVAVESGNVTGANIGDVVEVVGVLNANGSVRLIQSINGAVVDDAGTTGALALGSAWAGPKLWLNATGVGQSNENLADYADLKLLKLADVAAATAQGIMDELRAFELAPSGEIL